jgi:hypothetical protein
MQPSPNRFKRFWSAGSPQKAIIIVSSVFLFMCCCCSGTFIFALTPPGQYFVSVGQAEETKQARATATQNAINALTPHLTPTPKPTSTPKPTGTPSIYTTQGPTIMPTPVSLTASQKTQIQSILTDNLNHYKQIWQHGKDALGTTQYDDAWAGIEAFDDPNSAASKFRDWRQKEEPERDLSYYGAYDQAKAIYKDTSYDALDAWQYCAYGVVVDMVIWVKDAAAWQVKSITTTQLNNDAKTVNNDFVNVEKAIQDIK